MKSASIICRIVAITMALLMFLTSVGLTVDLHYCQGQLKTVNIFGKARSCHDIGAGMKNCSSHKQVVELEESAESKKDCCSSKTFYLQSDQDKQNLVENAVVVSVQLQYFIIAFVDIFAPIVSIGTDNPSCVYYNKSPFISRDIYALLEAYIL